MRVDLVCRAEFRTGSETRDLPNGSRQCGRGGGERLDQRPDRPAEFREAQPRIPRTDQRARVVDRSEALEICFNTLAHVLIEELVLRAQTRWREKGQPHLHLHYGKGWG